tara:strand:- start:673 stop:996 length:324 start_codon:yes stop_codon:yes gene_type:complete
VYKSIDALLAHHPVIARPYINYIIANQANQYIIAAKPKDRVRRVNLFCTSDLVLERIAGQQRNQFLIRDDQKTRPLLWTNLPPEFTSVLSLILSCQQVRNFGTIAHL